MRSQVRQLYIRFLRPHLGGALQQQRLKLLWDVWGYHTWMRAAVPLAVRLRMLGRFLRVDWSVPHGHKPHELGYVLATIAARAARPGEIVVEAGCWNGGSTVKLSIVCAHRGFELHVFDTFEGVPAGDSADGFDFAGTYAADISRVIANVTALGEISVVTMHKGIFADTLARGDVAGHPVRAAYVDCDTAVGTRDALQGIVPERGDDTVVFTQDFHIRSVREWVQDPTHWTELGCPEPEVQHLHRNLAVLRLPPA